MSNDEAFRLTLLVAGVTAEEMFDHPDYGLLVSAAGLQKLLRLTPDQDRAKLFPDYTPSSAKFGHRTNHEKSNVLRFSPRLLTHRRPSPGRTIDQVARLKEGIYHI